MSSIATVEEEVTRIDRQLDRLSDLRALYTPEMIRFLTRLEDPDDALEVEDVKREEVVEVLKAWDQFRQDEANSPA